jgi:hypothetical protein
MAEDLLTGYEIKDHVKRRKKESRGKTIGVELLNGMKIIGTLEESRPNILAVLDWEDEVVKDIHRALVRRFMIVIDGGKNDK